MNVALRWAMLGVGAVASILALLALYSSVVWQALTPAGQQAMRTVAGEATDTLLILVVLLAAAIAGALAVLHRCYVRPARRLAQSVVLIASANPAHRIAPSGGADLRDAAIAVNTLAAVYEESRHAAAEAIEAAHADVAHERNRLAAVVAELAHAVIVCAVDGTILLYNAAARALFAGADADALIGLGRSVYKVVDRELLDHTLERLRARLRHEAERPVAHFALTTGKGLTRAHLAPIIDTAGALEGYLLTFAGTPGDLASEESRQARVVRLIEHGRATLANMRIAAEALEACDLAERERFLGAIREEADAYTRHLLDATRHFEQAGPLPWPLDDIGCTDLLHAARDHLTAAGATGITLQETTGNAGVRVDSYAVLHLLAYLARLLGGRYAAPALYLRTSLTPHYVCLDLGTRDLDASTPPPADWDVAPITDRGELLGLGARQIVERQGGAVWHKTNLHERERYFRLLLVGAAAAAAAGTPRTTTADGRPEFYDFELFYRTARAVEEHARLDQLTYTVFDTETTGLEPSNGDEMIAIGAVRIVNGRVLTRDTFDQLIDPQRPLSAAAARITGIDAAMLVGQPTVGQVLPRFHRFCADTVLVAHNAAFDLRFLQLKEAATGVRFTQPVLDTLMLSAVLHPELESHQLDAIAERHGVTVTGRHTALGDALLTAEVFVRMLPQLAQHGILTLGDAQRASLKTYYARVHY